MKAEYRIEYRFNKYGNKPHVFDVVDDTGHCVTSFKSLNAEEAKAEARNFVASVRAYENRGTQNTLIIIGWTGSKRCYLNVPRDEAIKRYEEAEGEPAGYLDNLVKMKPQIIQEFTFDDEFGAYDAWKSK